MKEEPHQQVFEDYAEVVEVAPNFRIKPGETIRLELIKIYCILAARVNISKTIIKQLNTKITVKITTIRVLKKQVTLIMMKKTQKMVLMAIILEMGILLMMIKGLIVSTKLPSFHLSIILPSNKWRTFLTQ